MIDFAGTCRRHRPALIDFIDRGEIGPSTGAALAHLDRCDRCTTELESTVLAITALRRIGDDASRVEPSIDAWPRLRARLDGWRPARWAIMSPTAGVVMSAALVAVIIGPLQFGGVPTPSPRPIEDRGAVSTTERQVEADYISSTSRPRTVESAIGDSGLQLEIPAGTAVPRKYPDDIRPERKEVTPAGPSGYPPEAI